MVQDWNANLDVQFVVNAYEACQYMVNYVTKDDRGMSKLLRGALKEARQNRASMQQQLRYASAPSTDLHRLRPFSDSVSHEVHSDNLVLPFSSLTNTFINRVEISG